MAKKATRKENKSIYLPALLLFAVWPCLVHMQEMQTGLDGQAWFPDVAVQADFFMQMRSIGLFVLAGWMILCLIYRIVLQGRKSIQLKVIWPILVYLLLAVFSTIRSENLQFSLRGVTEQTETIGVLFAYAAVFLYFCDIITERNCMEQILFSMLAGALLQCLIGCSQLSGMDFWSSKIGQSLILLGTGSTQKLQFGFTSGGNNQIYMSFYNPNYAAVYIVLMLPFAVFAVIYFQEKWKKICAGMVSILLLINLWGTRSKAGFLTILALGFLAGWYYMKTRKNRMLFLLGCMCCLIAYSAGSVLLPGTSTGEKIIKNVVREKTYYPLKYVKPEQDEVRIRYKKEIYCLRIQTNGKKTWFSVTDREGNPCELHYRKKDGTFKIKGKGYKQLSFAAYAQGEEYHLLMYCKDIPYEFVKRDRNTPYRYLTLYGKEDTIQKAPYAFGRGYEKAFSKRVYLWSRTVPLLKDYLFLGSGPNTYALVFPQNDYVMRANLGIDMLMEIISRPHNIYLQCAVQTGVLSLLALLVLVVNYIRNVYAICRNKSDNKETSAFSFAVFLSVIGFLIMGIANDSLVVTTPVFCAVFGMGYGFLKREGK